MDDDDLEYFISFPTPKPYIKKLNRKFSSKPPKSRCIAENTVVSHSIFPIEEGNFNQVGQDAENTKNNSLMDPEIISVIVSDSDDSDDDLSGSLRSEHELPNFGNISEGREPVMLLLGWMGAADRHLAKYSALYTARGCICVRYTAPPMYLYFRHPTSYMEPLAEKLVAVLREMELLEHPLFCHVFSNHGATFYYYVSKALYADAERAKKDGVQPFKLRGCVFDSCPAPRRIVSGVRAVYGCLQGPVWQRFLGAIGAFFYLLGCSFVSILSTVITGTLPRVLPWALVQEARLVPQLFLYSEADEMIRSKDVEAFLAERQKMGVPVSARRWNDSPHVQHYRCHPDEYSRTVFQFLFYCMARPLDSSRSLKPPSALLIDKSVSSESQFQPNSSEHSASESMNDINSGHDLNVTVATIEGASESEIYAGNSFMELQCERF